MKQTTEEKLLLAAQIVRENGRWEYAEYYDGSSQWDWTDPEFTIKTGPWKEGDRPSVLVQIIGNSKFVLREFEGKFPALPGGEEWYNPTSAKPKDIPNGYRLLTKTEESLVKAGTTLITPAGQALITPINRDGVLLTTISTPMILRKPFYFTQC